MTLLAIETSTQVCSAALATDGVVVAARIDREGGNHARQLPVFIDELIHIARDKGLHLDAVALSEGPGSYTGLRIGTSTAKGLCYGLNIPLVAIPTTEVLCAGAAKVESGKWKVESALCPMIDARRMEIYTALYDTDIRPLSEIQACVIDSRDAMHNVSPSGKDVYFFGDGAAKCRELLENEHWHLLPDIVPDAANMFGLAARYIDEGKVYKSAAELAYYEPFYLKDFVAAKSHVKGLE